jgi:hypothetical protein
VAQLGLANGKKERVFEKCTGACSNGSSPTASYLQIELCSRNEADTIPWPQHDVKDDYKWNKVAYNDCVPGKQLTLLTPTLPKHTTLLSMCFPARTLDARCAARRFRDQSWNEGVPKASKSSVSSLPAHMMACT